MRKGPIDQRDRRFSPSSLYRTYKKLRNNPDTILIKRGRPNTLSIDQENTLLERLHSIQNSLSHLTNDLIVREAIYVAPKIGTGMYPKVYLK